MKRYSNALRVTLSLWLIFQVGVSVAENDTQIVVSENDDREYRYLQLDNKLQVLLISDAQAEKAAAALDIFVGSNQNPKDREGLAHFLEHMLFLGTEKYPESGEYQKFVSEHGGRNNAYTSSEHTNYFFDVDSRYLEDGLDRFAQFFVAPLFDKTYVDRERHAVESEYKLRIKNETRRRLDVFSEVVNQEHPTSMFRTGNLITLADRKTQSGDVDSARDALVKFYNEYYSANLMSLVVLGKEPLDELEAMTVSRFSKIVNNNVVVEDKKIPQYTEGFLPARVDVVPLKEERLLQMSFPMPVSRQYYAQKPLQYIGNLLGHEGEGSLLSFLKRYGWAEGLSAGGGDQTRFNGNFDINISLTPRGVKAVDQIVALTFQVIQNLERKGVKKWRFEEDKKLAEIAFRFQEKGRAIDTVSALASRLHSFEAKDVLQGGYLFSDFNAPLIKDYLSYLRADNLLLTVTAPDLDTNKVSRWYSTPYKVSPLKSVAPFVIDKYSRELFFPEENLFIPQRLRVKSTSLLNEKLTGDQALPVKIVDSAGYGVWFQQDTKYQVPRSNIILRLKLPMVAQSVKTAAMNRLFVALVNDSLNEFSYPASLAGLNFDVSSNSRGIDIDISGYNDRQGLLLTRIVETIRKARFDKERFERVQLELIRGWKNSRKSPPYQQLAREVASNLFEPLWQPQQLEKALGVVSLADFNEFNASLLVNAEAEVLFFGNLYRQEAMKLAALIENQLLQKTGELALPRAQVVKLESRESADLPYLYQHPVEHKDTAAVLYLQGLDDSLNDRAKMMLLRQMLHSPFFNSLRTEKQLGYIVMASAMPLKKVPGTIMIVQSPTADGERLMAEIDGFLEGFSELIPDNIKTHQDAVMNNLLQAPKNLSQQSSRYWDDILHKSVNFDRRELLAKAVASTTSAEMKAYFQSVSAVNRRLWLLSKVLPKPALNGVKLIDDSSEFKNESVVYSYR